MSEFHVEVVRISNVQKHPNADSLSTCEVNGYPVIFKTGDFKEGDKAVYVPVDSICPEREPFLFLGEHRRIKARRLRGIFSMGLLVPANPLWKVGKNVQKEMGIEKWEPVADRVPVQRPKTLWRRIKTLCWNFYRWITKAPKPKCPMPEFTDIEGYRRVKHVLKDGEMVVLTEKIHGANARYCWDGKRFWVASHHVVKSLEDNSMWNKVAAKYELEDKLKKIPRLVLFGEVYGDVQDLKYGAAQGGLFFAAFDLYDLDRKCYLDFKEFAETVDRLGIPRVPVLYTGPWSKDLEKLSCGKTTMMGNHCREGFVVKPLAERYEHAIGRFVVKFVGEDYLMRKGA